MNVYKDEKRNYVRYEFKWLDFGHVPEFPTYTFGYGLAKSAHHFWINYNQKCPKIIRPMRFVLQNIIWVTKWHSKNHGKILKFSGSIAKPYEHFYFRLSRLYIGGDTPKWIKRLKKWWKWFKIDKKCKKNPDTLRCDKCGSHRLRDGHGLAYEPIIWCKKCGNIVYQSDPTPYII